MIRPTLETFRDGKRVRALHNAPALVALVRAGYVSRTRDAAGLYATYASTDRGRRKLNMYRAYAAGAGK